MGEALTSADRSTSLESTVALVTGGNRGLGLAFVHELLDRGAQVVIGTRSTRDVVVPGARIVPLDVTDPGSVARLPELVPDLTMLVNNAGLHLRADIDRADAVALTRRVFDVNVFGLIAVTAALHTLLIQHGGVVINVLSAGSWLSGPGSLAYAASKSAALSASNSTRAVLGPQGVQVLSLHAGFIDTDMMASFTGPKLAPSAVAAATLDAVTEGRQELLIDRMSASAKAAASSPVPDFHH